MQTELTNNPIWMRAVGTAAWLVVALALVLVAHGCERREKILKIETPGTNVEVDRTTTPDGEVKDLSIEVDRN